MVHLRGAALLLLAVASLAARANYVVVEFYNASLGHYFMTPRPEEIAALDNHVITGWTRTGFAFDTYSPDSHPAGTVGFCRFYNDHFLGTSTHFFGAHGGDCEVTIAEFPDWTLEISNLFYAYVPPDPAGACPAGQYPVYRVFNNGAGGAPNHRYTNSDAVRQQMVAMGYASEGVRLCTPSAPPATPARASAEGIWHGTTASGQGFDVVVLASGKYYIAYTVPGAATYAGVVDGTGTSANGTFASSDARDFQGLTPATPMFGFGSSVSGTYLSGQTLSLTSSGTTDVAQYDAGYDLPSTIAAVAGQHAGTLGHATESNTATISIDADGTFSVVGVECSYDGTVTPHASDGLFDLVVFATRAPCKNVPDFVAGAPGTMYYSSTLHGYVALVPFTNTVTGRGADVLFFVFP